MIYKPDRLETWTVELSPDLEALTERLAENAHDLWAQQRLSEGWRHGPQRDDARKLHPCLVPYAKLSETDKGCDRITAIETIKAISRSGYRIERA